jgi:hypothetical protein
MQVKTQKMDSFGVSGDFLAQIGSSARPGFSPQKMVVQSTSGLAIGGFCERGKELKSLATYPNFVHFEPKYLHAVIYLATLSTSLRDCPEINFTNLAANLPQLCVGTRRH